MHTSGLWAKYPHSECKLYVSGGMTWRLEVLTCKTLHFCVQVTFVNCWLFIDVNLKKTRQKICFKVHRKVPLVNNFKLVVIIQLS